MLQLPSIGAKYFHFQLQRYSSAPTRHLELVTPERPHIPVLGAAAAHDPPHRVPLLDAPDFPHEALQVQHHVVISLTHHHSISTGQVAPDIALQKRKILGF